MGAEIIKIKDANYFFQHLLEKVITLEEFYSAHPLTVKAAVATLKRYLSDERYIIKLHDLINDETEKVFSKLNDEETFQIVTLSSCKEELPKRLKHYESLLETLMALIIQGCYWGNDQHIRIWQKCLERIASVDETKQGIPLCLNLRYYPAL